MLVALLGIVTVQTRGRPGGVLRGAVLLRPPQGAAGATSSPLAHSALLALLQFLAWTCLYRALLHVPL